MDDLAGSVLAHLHANDRMDAAQLAATLGAPRADVEAAIDRLLADGHLERQGEELVPTAASHPTPGLFVASERQDAEADEVDYPDDVA